FDFQNEDVAIRPQELAMAESLIDSLASDFDPDEFSDDYRDAVVALLDSKLAGGDAIVVESSPETPGSGDVIDLMAALRESVKRSGGTLQEQEPEPDPPEEKASAKKPAANKSSTAESGTGKSSTETASKKAGERTTRKANKKTPKKSA
ncbi:MAG: Ku protein, partial [Actinomycetia bacterium]|nr:Ku protein [Actinomycetes bacterium]